MYARSDSTGAERRRGVEGKGVPVPVKGNEGVDVPKGKSKVTATDAGDEGSDVWHSYDDHEVTKVQAKDVKTRAAYILFYRKRPPHSRPSLSPEAVSVHPI